MSYNDYGSVKTNSKTFQESLVKNSSNGSLNSQDSAHDLEAGNHDKQKNKSSQSEDSQLGLKKKVLLMGLDRSGKSSISKVLFSNDVQAKNNVINLGNYVNIIENLKGKLLDLKIYEIENFDMNEILQLQQLYYNNNLVNKNNVNEGIGEISNEDIEDAFYKNSGFSKFFDDVGTIIYVVDSTSEYLASLANLSMLIELAYKFHKANNDTSDDFNINFEVLIHKVDSLNEDFKLDTQRDIMQRIQDELLDLGIENVAINFYLTSIFDYSIYEAFSRITQKLILELPFIENLLDNFIMNCHNSIDKIFLFDINSKIYISTDSSPVNILSYEVCSEFIDVTLDLKDLYEDENPKKNKKKALKAYSRLNNDFSIYMNEVFKNLCVVILINNNNANEFINNEVSNAVNFSNVSNKMLMTLIDYNFNILKGTLKKVLK
ncbi:hypothetical protein FOG51_00771 [Hanseniaspora uvarum]|nr:hypothetical protein FOG48_01137 [Hanseniaspora uvarum]KAF0274320.1 hypothetical protein FOG51_00771 [Hanseniaspora uvarum]KAF0279049.1 hypothetical protein FOG50_00091 [Hanseniaspora uvarum]GMM42119.1 Gtr2 protein [Hanseniaspora uvarum]